MEERMPGPGAVLGLSMRRAIDARRITDAIRKRVADDFESAEAATARVSALGDAVVDALVDADANSAESVIALACVVVALLDPEVPAHMRPAVAAVLCEDANAAVGLGEIGAPPGRIATQTEDHSNCPCSCHVESNVGICEDCATQTEEPLRGSEIPS